MAKIEFVNMGQVMAGIKKRQEKLKNIPKVARQMGLLATNEIHPLTQKKTGNWDNSIHAEVKQLKSFQWELWVGSKGAFSDKGYNYGAKQERLNHPIEIGWGRARGPMVDLWNKIMHGVASSSITESIPDNFEFASMAGM